MYEATKLLKTRWVSGKRQYLVKWKDNSPPSWQYENDVSEALKAAFHTAKALIKSKNSGNYCNYHCFRSSVILLLPLIHTIKLSQPFIFFNLRSLAHNNSHFLFIFYF
jgi:hypothetical protein